MPKNYLRQSALAHLHLEAHAVEVAGDAGVKLCERPFRGQLVLRGNCTDKAFHDAVQRALGVTVPDEPNSVTDVDRVSVIWLGPDEWLVVVPDGHEQATAQALRQALTGRHFAVTDVSDSRAIIGISGSHARDVLKKGCSVDLHPRVFGPGQCAQTALARCHMLLHQIDQAPTYDIYVHRSFADYVWCWLEDAAQEYGFAIIAQAPGAGEGARAPESERLVPA
ncbi:MAG: sarcosine oxidase subunit gamma [Acidiferrobacterales bacterium]